MSFKYGYYKELCDHYLELLKPINKTNRFCDEEVLRRDFVSRSYYTALLHCRDNMDSLTDDYNGGTHEQIITSIENNSIEEDLRNLKALRVKADYHTVPFPAPLKVKNTVVHLQRVNAIVNNILTKTKVDLLKSKM